MDYGEAAVEQRRISGLLEDNPHYQYRTTVQPFYEEFGDATVAGYYVGVGWYAVRYDDDEVLHEYGFHVAVTNPGASVGELKHLLHQNYVATMVEP